MSAPPFELDPPTYDALIDWPARLANEEPLYRALFAEAGVRKVLDAACGTGRHAALLHSWGLEVEGADLSPEMIAYCRATHGASDTLRWVVRGFTQPAAPGVFDAALCTGNSLALAPDRAAAAATVGALVAAVRPGGLVVVQVLNLWRLPDGPMQWQKCRLVPADGPPRVLLKGLHRCGERAFIEFVDLRVGAAVRCETHTSVMLGLRPAELEAAARAAGAASVQFYGDYRRQVYDPTSSPDLILVARRGSHTGAAV